MIRALQIEVGDTRMEVLHKNQYVNFITTQKRNSFVRFELSLKYYSFTLIN